MAILSSIRCGGEGEDHRDSALNLLGVRRAGHVYGYTSDLRTADTSAATVRLASIRTDH